MKLTDLLESDDRARLDAFDWLKIYSGDNHSMKDIAYRSGSIDVTGDVEISRAKTIPFKFGEVSGSFNIGSTTIDSIENFPEKIGSWLRIYDCSKLTSLKGIDKIVKEIGTGSTSSGAGVIAIGMCDITGGILGLMKIKGVKEIHSISSGDDDKLLQAISILNKNLGKGKEGILAAQNELLDNDLDDFAEF